MEVSYFRRISMRSWLMLLTLVVISNAQRGAQNLNTMVMSSSGANALADTNELNINDNARYIRIDKGKEIDVPYTSRDGAETQRGGEMTTPSRLRTRGNYYGMMQQHDQGNGLASTQNRRSLAYYYSTPKTYYHYGGWNTYRPPAITQARSNCRCPYPGENRQGFYSSNRETVLPYYHSSCQNIKYLCPGQRATGPLWKCPLRQQASPYSYPGRPMSVRFSNNSQSSKSMDRKSYSKGYMSKGGKSKGSKGRRKLPSWTTWYYDENGELNQKDSTATAPSNTRQPVVVPNTPNRGTSGYRYKPPREEKVVYLPLHSRPM